MAFLNPKMAVDLVLEDGAVITVADDKDVRTVPFNCEIVYARVVLGSTGTTSGNNDVVVEYTPPGGSAGDLWTVGAGVGRIAYDASAPYLEMDRDDLDVTKLRAGGSLALNVDAVAGGGSPGAPCVVILTVYPTDD